jgi:hypothetical protein
MMKTAMTTVTAVMPRRNRPLPKLSHLPRHLYHVARAARASPPAMRRLTRSQHLRQALPLRLQRR